MSILTNYYSLVEQAKRIDPNGEQAQIAEVLNREMGEILTDAPWIPSNDIWVNKTTRRSGLPTGQRKKLNKRITAHATTTEEVMDVLGMVADYCEIDADLVNSMPSPAVFLSGEVDAFIEGIGQTVVSDILYSDSNKDPDAIHGVGPRLDTVDDRFVIDAGGAGSDLTSVYAINWSPQDAFLMYPKNMAANMGILHEDKGFVTSETSDGLIEIHRDYFKIVFGLCVRNPRSIGRLANIEQLSVGANTFDENDLITLLNNMKTGPGMRLYMNETIMTQGQIRLKDKGNVYWTPGSGLSGEPFLYFSGVPVRKIAREILLNTETEIS